MAYACLPTQQVEVTTHISVTTHVSVTTTTQVTTTTPGPATPCVTCQKVYDTTCTGYVPGHPSCATASEATVTYDIGMIYTDASFHYYEDGACLLVFSCPHGTNIVVDAYGAATPSQADLKSYEVGYCEETGADAGQWYYSQPYVASYAPFKMRSFKCAG